MQEVDSLAVDLGDELRNLVETSFLGAPIEVMPPVVGELLEISQRHATGKVGASVWSRIGPTRGIQPPRQII